MKYFFDVLNLYKDRFHGIAYMPLRWIINPFEKIASLMPISGTIVDLGCGEGVMAALLAVSGPKREVIGIDNNKIKIELAKNVAKKVPNLNFKLQDLLKSELEKADGFVLSDFLHHTPPRTHPIILKKIWEATKKGGTVIIKEVDSGEFLRSKMARGWDFLFYPKEKTYYWNSGKLKELLQKLGFRVSIRREARYFPSSTTLFICKK